MQALYSSLPSEKKMKGLCHGDPDQWLPLQATSLLIVLSLVLIAICAAVETLSAVPSFLTANGPGNTNLATLQEELQSAVIYGFATAASIVALVVFVKLYLRALYGPPAYFSELQADLSQESVVEICEAYMRAQSLNEILQVESSGRLVGLMFANSHSSTYLEITTLALDQNRTWLGVRGASIVVRKAALLSTFYNDFGAAKEAADKIMEIFTPYASRQRRPIQGARRSQQAMPRLKPMAPCPPPLSIRSRQEGWQLSARARKLLT